ncbi:unnamed protein product [Adineta steineri]|uniref:Uncharacterized protein n=1 Tax=Adineta steineri TaxID=433720 RepID=A0A814WCR5_9BILA|nr:unnamed protein product [Adineta steineri]
MATSLAGRYLLSFTTFLTLAWLCTCAVLPYWKAFQPVDKIDLGGFGKTFPTIQGFFNKATEFFSIDIGIVYSCFNGQTCVLNRDIKQIPFVRLPEDKHAAVLGFGLSLLAISLM